MAGHPADRDVLRHSHGRAAQAAQGHVPEDGHGALPDSTDPRFDHVRAADEPPFADDFLKTLESVFVGFALRKVDKAWRNVWPIH